MKRKLYQKPSMKVIKIQQSQILCVSQGAKSIGSSSEGISWQDGGFSDEEGDY